MIFLNVLRLIDEKHQRGASPLCSGADDFQQRLQVVLQVPVVGKPGLRIEIEADLDVLVLDLEGARETRQSSERALGEILGRLVPRKPQQGLPQLRRQHGGQRAAFGRFDAHRLDAGRLGIVTHAVEQYGLPDAPEAEPHPLDRHPDGFTQLVYTDIRRFITNP